MKRGKKKLYPKQIKSSISKSKNKKLNKKTKKKSSKFNFRNIENNLSDHNSNIDLSNFQETDKYGNSNENKYDNLSSVLSTKANGAVFQAHDSNCYIGSLTALLKSIEKINK